MLLKKKSIIQITAPTMLINPPPPRTNAIGTYSVKIQFFFFIDLNPKVIILVFGLLQLDIMQGNSALKHSKNHNKQV